MLNVAFVFLMLGYGTKVGLAPLHAWLPDAHAEGPTPISAVLSGLLLNVALYALLRFKMLLATNPAALAPGPLMVTMGLVSLIFAAFMLYRRRDIKRMFAYSSIEHMGLITFAFGMGGALANFAGLLHMTMHSLTKSAIFFAVGHIAQVKGTQKLADIRGLTTSHPVLGWGLVLGVVAIAGLPPLGIFMSEFLIVSSTFAREPLLAIPLVFGLLVAFGALMLRVGEVAFGEPVGSTAPVEASYVPLFAHLALVAAGRHLSAGPAGGLVPERGKAAGLEERTMAFIAALQEKGRAVEGHRPWPRVVVDEEVWRQAILGIAAGEATLSRVVERRGGGASCACRARGRQSAGRQPAVPRAPLPLRSAHASARVAPGAHHPRPVWTGARGCPDERRWLDHGRWGLRHPLGEREARWRRRRCLRLPHRGRAAAASDPRRARARRHHRARTLPLHRQRRDRRAPGGTAGVCAQRHRPPHDRRADRARGAGWRAGFPATARSPMRSPSRARSRRRRAASRRRARCGCAR